MVLFIEFRSTLIGMSKPTNEELKTALTAAIDMKEHDNDPYFVAKALLNLQYRMRYYEELMSIADRYANLGQAEHEHTLLLKQIDKIKDVEMYTGKYDLESFGLE